LNNNGDNLNSCLRELAEKLRPYMRTGLPDYGVPRVEPLTIKETQLKLAKAAIDVTVTFKDVTGTGLANFVLNSVVADKARQTISTDITVPSIESSGQYSMTGTAFVDVSKSKGPFRVKMNDVNVVMSVQLVKRNGRLLIEQDPDIKVKVGKLNVELENLFGGEAPIFARTITKFINEENDKFIQDFGPQITNQVGSLGRGLYNAAVTDLDPSLFGLN